MADINALKKELKTLETDHAAAEKTLLALMCCAIPEHVEIQRVKKQKLDLKDRIQALKRRMFPDIIA